jgi:hypothetical protein
MNEEHFMSLWFSPSIESHWVNDPSTLYWARSYNMDEGLLRIMSRDLLSIRGYNKKRNSATNLASHILKEIANDIVLD